MVLSTPEMYCVYADVMEGVYTQCQFIIHTHTHTCTVALEVNIFSSDVTGARFVFVGQRATFTATPSSTIASVSGSLRTQMSSSPSLRHKHHLRHKRHPLSGHIISWDTNVLLP